MQRRVAVEGGEPQRVDPREGGNVADARVAGIAPGEQASYRHRVAPDPVGEGLARSGDGRSGARASTSRMTAAPSDAAAVTSIVSTGTEVGVVAESAIARGQRAGQHHRVTGAPAALAGRASGSQRVPGPDIHHQVGSLVRDPTARRNGSRAGRGRRRTRGRGKPAGSTRPVRRRMGHREGAHRPPRPAPLPAPRS